MKLSNAPRRRPAKCTAVFRRRVGSFHGIFTWRPAVQFSPALKPTREIPLSRTCVRKATRTMTERVTNIQSLATSTPSTASRVAGAALRRRLFSPRREHCHGSGWVHRRSPLLNPTAICRESKSIFPEFGMDPYSALLGMDTICFPKPLLMP